MVRYIGAPAHDSRLIFPEKAVASEALADLNRLIGLEKVKELVFELYAFADVQRRRQMFGMPFTKPVLHSVFIGNPGTGKTTVARILGRLYKDCGLLEKGHVIEVERADLVGEYVGHTAQKTREQVRRASGGILFIDEAYSLARGGEKDFGKECIDCLVKAMEDTAQETVFVLAGYPAEMEQFLRTNPGLRSRFPIRLEFPDYTVDELTQIALLMLREREYRLAPDAHGALRSIIQEAISLEATPSNARGVRNLVERAIRRQAVRLVKTGSYSRNDLLSILAVDLLEAAASPR